MKTRTEDILVIESTPKTPYVYMDPGEGKIVFRGAVIPGDYIAFFKPIIEYLETNFISINKITAHFEFYYFNSSAGKGILDTLKILERLRKSGSDVKVFWYYEEDDKDMFEAGEDYEQIILVPFSLIEIIE